MYVYGSQDWSHCFNGNWPEYEKNYCYEVIKLENVTFYFFPCITIFFNLHFLSCRPYQVTFRAKFFFLFPGFKGISSVWILSFLPLCTCHAEMILTSHWNIHVTCISCLHSHHVQFGYEWSTSLGDRMFRCRLLEWMQCAHCMWSSKLSFLSYVLWKPVTLHKFSNPLLLLSVTTSPATCFWHLCFYFDRFFKS